MTFLKGTTIQSHTQIPTSDPGDFNYTVICSLETVEGSNNTPDVRELPPLTKLFVNVIVDLSYSMDSEGNLDHAKKAVKTMLTHMKGQNVAVKISAFHCMTLDITSEYTAITEETLLSLNAKIDALDTDGGAGTNISAALLSGMTHTVNQVAKVAGSHGYIVLLTDGIPNLGITDGKVIHTNLYSGMHAPINIGAIALGAQPERKFMEDITKGGKFFYAPNAKALHAAYEEIEAGFDQLLRNCDIECFDGSNQLLGSKKGSSRVGETISLAIDLSYEQLRTIEPNGNDRTLTFKWRHGPYFEGETSVTLTTGDQANGVLPPEIEAHRQLIEANRQIEAAIQSVGTDGVDVAIGRLVNLANTANVIAQNTPNVPSVAHRSMMINNAVHRTTTTLRSIHRHTPYANPSRHPRGEASVVASSLRRRAPAYRSLGSNARGDMDEEYNDSTNSDDYDIYDYDAPERHIPDASLDLIAGELSSQVTNY